MKKSYAKQKLMSAAAMLGVSVMMLSSASFAWFSVSTAPEVKAITSKVEANENLEIAMGNTDPGASNVGDTSNNKKWGALIDYSTVQAVGNLGPAKLDNGALKTISYGADGRPDALDVTLVDGGYVDSNNFIGVYSTAASDGAAMATYWDMVLRTNVAGTITLEVPSNAITVADGAALTADKVKFALAYKTGDANYAFVEAGTGFSATANTVYNVRLVMYLDGESVTNAMLGADIDSVSFSGAKFKNSAIDNGTFYAPAAPDAVAAGRVTAPSN